MTRRSPTYSPKGGPTTTITALKAAQQPQYDPQVANLQPQQQATNHHMTRRLPAYSPKGGPASTIRPVGRQATAPKAAHQPPYDP